MVRRHARGISPPQRRRLQDGPPGRRAGSRRTGLAALPGTALGDCTLPVASQRVDTASLMSIPDFPERRCIEEDKVKKACAKSKDDWGIRHAAVQLFFRATDSHVNKRGCGERQPA